MKYLLEGDDVPGTLTDADIVLMKAVLDADWLNRHPRCQAVMRFYLEGHNDVGWAPGREEMPAETGLSEGKIVDALEVLMYRGYVEPDGLGVMSATGRGLFVALVAARMSGEASVGQVLDNLEWSYGRAVKFYDDAGLDRYDALVDLWSHPGCSADKIATLIATDPAPIVAELAEWKLVEPSGDGWEATSLGDFVAILGLCMEE